MMGASNCYPLQVLSYDDCLSVFAQHALGAKNFDAHLNLQEIGAEIVKRCKGLPLAAKALGGLLRGKPTQKEWEKVLTSKMWELPEDESGILPALKVSYYHLPSHLKPCFAYCAIFTKDYEFDKDELVSLWKAEGFLQQTEENRQTRDLGYEYFHELLSRSLFQPSSENKTLYVMHDLLNDLARLVSGEIWFNLDDKSEGARPYAEVRHSAFTRHFYDIAQRFEIFQEMRSLRTFVALPISETWRRCLSSKVLNDLVPKLERLRVLSLSHYNIVELPSSMGALRHLRYLNMAGTEIERLPESVSKLFNLQMLILYGCQKLIKLPVDLSNLINLQCLDISDTGSLQQMPLHMGKLVNLHTLTKFIVGNGDGLGIKELMNFCHLQGKLHITGLQNVVNIQDVERANMRGSQELKELVFEWMDDFSVSRNEEQELKVLKALQPQQKLEKLSVKSYGGKMFPSWVGIPSFSNMVFVELNNCPIITSLPQLGQLPSLKDLSIKGMAGVKEVGLAFYGEVSSCVNGFSSLETLNIEDMAEWEQWYWSNNWNEGGLSVFPNLRELTLYNCPKLIGNLPRHLPSLEVLTICRCPLLANLPEMLPSLLKLKIERCKEGIFTGPSHFRSLAKLVIEKIIGLVSLNEVFVQALAAVEVMEISCCDELAYLWDDGINLDTLACLKQLVIEGCDNLEKLPNGLHCLTALSDLTIHSCKKLVSFPATDLPYSLKNLKITGCCSLKSLPMKILCDRDNSSNTSQLEELIIMGCPSLSSFPIGEFPSSLKSLSICNGAAESLESLSICNTSLEVLWMWRCPKLQFLPKEGLPDTLGCLSIIGCPLLEEPCKKGKGAYWSVIAHIPRIFQANFDFHA